MDEKKVIPGSFLSIGEEYLPGENAFEHQNGSVYSSSVGVSVFDESQKTVNVESRTRPVKLIDAGSVVFGRVDLVKESMVFVDVFEAKNNGEPRKVGSASAVLAVFNVKNSYVEDLSEMFKIGDIIKARVMGVTPFNVELETKSSPELGVVKGYCDKCRALVRMLDNGFKCTKCATQVFRKFSSEYLIK